MSPEHSQHPTEPENAGRSDFVHVKPESASVISAVLDRVDDARARFHVLNGYLTHGPSFAAFLTLASTDAIRDPATLNDRFQHRYRYSWATQAELVDDHAEALGWDEALDAFCSAHRIPDRLVAWNKDEFITWLRQTLDIVPLDGQWHVFSETETDSAHPRHEPTERRCHP